MRETQWHGQRIEFLEDGEVRFQISTPAPEQSLGLSERKRFYEYARKWVSGEAGQVEILESDLFDRL